MKTQPVGAGAANASQSERLQRCPPLDPFRVLDRAERERNLVAYLQWLQQRDGEPDLARRSLSGREAFFQDLDAHPYRSSIAVDASAFDRAMDGEAIPTTADASLDQQRLWWLGAAARANRGERYGVELVLKRHDHAPPTLQQDLFVHLEEVYHTRILLDACQVFGLSLEMNPPPRGTRWLIGLMARSPEVMALPLALAGEIVGCAVFQLLLDRLTLFAQDPEAHTRLEGLLQQILIDEIGHVAYCRTRIGAAGLRFARSVLPTVVRTVARDVPELVPLAGGLPALLEAARRFDVAHTAAIRAQMFDADQLAEPSALAA